MTSPERSKPKTRARQKSGAKAIGQELEAAASGLPARFGELEWHERAAFHVSLERADDDAHQVHWQTQAYHEETDSRAIWPGVPGEAMISWICDKAGLTNATPKAAPSDLQLTISELRLGEVSIERQIGEPSPPRITFRYLSSVIIHRPRSTAELCAADLGVYPVRLNTNDLGRRSAKTPLGDIGLYGHTGFRPAEDRTIPVAGGCSITG